MDDINENEIITTMVENRQECWNSLLKKYMKERNMTQADLAKALNEKYNTQYTQKTISRWMNLGSKKGMKRFPDYENMVILADFFGMEVGHLTGETEFDSFNNEKCYDYLGLTDSAIDRIRRITGRDIGKAQSHMMLYHMDKTNALNELLSSDDFICFFEHIYELFSMSSKSIGTNHPEFDDIMPANNYVIEFNQSRTAIKYQLFETLVHMIDNLCPPLTTDDLTIHEY